MSDFGNETFRGPPAPTPFTISKKIIRTMSKSEILYCIEQGMDTPTYTSPNTGEKPKALEAVLKKSENKTE